MRVLGFIKKLGALVLLFLLSNCEKARYDDDSTSPKASSSEYIVSSKTAQNIAKELLKNFKLTSTGHKGEVSVATTTIQDENNNPYFHVINTQNNTENSFVIVSGDKRTAPIIGYGKEGFDINEAPDQFQFWLRQFKSQIDSLRTNQIEAVEKLADYQQRILRDNSYNSNTNNGQFKKSMIITEPYLVSTKWNQGCVYNSFSPINGSTIDLSCNTNLPCNRAYTGCVSTCVSQMIGFYKTLDHVNYDLLKDTYELSDLNTAQGNEVGKLMRTVGDIMEMNYLCSGSGSPADQLLEESEIVQKLGFSSSIKKRYYNRSSIYTILSEIKSGNPVVFSGIDRVADGGHFWIADGIHQTKDFDLYVHFNWGWGGNRNGWFLIGDFKAGNYDFSRLTQVLYNFRK